MKVLPYGIAGRDYVVLTATAVSVHNAPGGAWRAWGAWGAWRASRHLLLLCLGALALILAIAHKVMGLMNGWDVLALVVVLPREMLCSCFRIMNHYS